MAFSGVVALGIILAMLIMRQGEERAASIRNVNNMLWGLSELNYTSQLLATSLVHYSNDPAQREAAQVAFDVMWSRMDVARQEQLGKIPGFTEVFARYRVFLQAADPLLFGEAPVPPEVLLLLAHDVTEIARLSRQTWLDSFSFRKTDWEISEAVGVAGQTYHVLEIILALLVLSLLVYVFVEIWFASKAARREAELHLAASRASEAKSRFLATVSHEVRTPLNGILGTAALLSETALSREQDHYVKVMQQAGRVLLDMINDILDFSKLEAGQFSIVASDFDLDDVLSTAQGLYGPLAKRKALGFTVWHAPGQTLRLHGDARRLQQVINNLVSNAIKFTDSGSVEVTARYGALGQGGAEGLCVWVSDTGCGIAESELAQVFQPFGQSSSGLDRSHAGTGLGLTISRDLCEAMGGHLSLTSELGVGSTFEVFVPLKVADTPAVPEETPDSPERDVDLSGLDVLIVDDNRTNRFILRKLLARMKCLPMEAGSGAEALTLVSERMPSVILMDVQMPGMDGMVATRKVMEAAARHGVPAPCVIGVTANTLPEQIAAYLEAGMTEVVSKPVRKTALKDALANVLVDARKECA